MSKTVEEIGLIVGGIGLALVSGPLGIIVLQGSIAAFHVMLGIGLTTAMAGVGLALRPTPKLTTANGSVSFQNGVSPRRVIYGQSQVSGVLTYATFPAGQNQSTNSEFLHLVYTIAGHQITSFDGVIIDGVMYNFGVDIFQNGGLPSTPWQVQPAAYSTNPNDFYWQHMFFEFDCGNPANHTQPFPNLASSDSAWTNAFQQLGCAKVHVILRSDSAWTAVFPNGQIPNFQFLITGKQLTDPRVTTAWQPSTGYAHFTYTIDNNGYIWFQQNTAGPPVSGSSRPNFEGFDVAGDVLSDNTCSWYNTGWTLTGVYNGNPLPPQLFNSRLVNDGWQPGPGISYGTGAVDQLVIEAPTGYFQLLTTAGTPATSHPTFSTLLGGTTIDGTAVWTCLGPSTHAINPSNPALIVNDYLQDTDYGMATSLASIDTASVIAAANVCEEPELIIWNADNTKVYENLYSCNGMFDHSSTRGNVLDALSGSMAGWVVPPGDQWHVFAGAYITPIISLTDNDLRGSIKGDFRLSKRDAANGVKGTYNPAFLPTNPGAILSLTQIPGTWHSQSYPAYQANGMIGKPNYLNTEDGGQIIWQDVNFEFTTSIWMAQRLAKIALMRLRFQETLTLPFKLTAFQLEAGDTFYFTHARWGIVAAAYEVTQCSIVLDTSGKDSAPVVGIDIIARQTDPSIYSFTAPSSPTVFGEYSPYGVTGVMTGVE